MTAQQTPFQTVSNKNNYWSPQVTKSAGKKAFPDRLSIFTQSQQMSLNKPKKGIVLSKYRKEKLRIEQRLKKRYAYKQKLI